MQYRVKLVIEKSEMFSQSTRTARLLLGLSIATVVLLFQPAFAADKLRISYSGPSISNALLWVTKEGKLFERNGLDAEVLYLAGSLGQSALIAGETQFAVYTGLLVTPARLQGADVVMVASFLTISCPDWSCVPTFVPSAISKENVVG
jgi:ABC-type nitrate/sulfonate/bicarbonate transport system substrate-binding protein